MLFRSRAVHWVWVSTSSMMFRRSLIDLVFPDDDQTFRLHMDFYIVIMAQMVAGSLLIDDALYSYRLHGRNFAANNPEWELLIQEHWAHDPNIRRMKSDYPVDVTDSDMSPVMFNGVGGSSIYYGAEWPRLAPSDFRVKSLIGVADDWPISYDELKPYHDEVDIFIGASGLGDDPSAKPLVKSAGALISKLPPASKELASQAFSTAASHAAYVAALFLFFGFIATFSLGKRSPRS